MGGGAPPSRQGGRRRAGNVRICQSREAPAADTVVAEKDKDKDEKKREHKTPNPEHNGHTPAPGDPHYQGMPKKK
jgi:hypothetical protein